MYEDFDYFDDLDEKASASTNNSNELLRQKWRVTMASDDMQEIEEVLAEIDLNAGSIRRQIELYRQFPSQREEKQTFEWLKRAMTALNYHETMYRALCRHQEMLRDREMEEKKHRRMVEQADLVIKARLLEARTKVATLKLEIKRTRDRNARLIHLLGKMGVLYGLDLRDLNDRARSAPTGEEMRAQEDLERWKEKLKQVKAEIEKLKELKIS
jgi:hypothetical protein